jgi:pyrroloquinoline quinone biosynthesis protein B
LIVRVLGSAAGGGVPQWNCACANCAAARDGRRPKRTQSTIAVTAGGDRWLLVNCSPDIAAQIEAYPALQPKSTRGTPIAAMLFTDANIDHLGGLAVLRQCGAYGFILRSSPLVRSLAQTQPAFSPFMAAPHEWLDVPFEEPLRPVDRRDPVGNELDVMAFSVPGTSPGYDGRRVADGAAIAYEISDAAGDVVLFAPVFAAIDPRLSQAIARARIAFLDGSFFSDDEMIVQGLSEKTARHLGHLPVGGSDGTLAHLGTNARVIFTHVNNSNPMLDPDSAATGAVHRAGANVAFDGLEITLS